MVAVIIDNYVHRILNDGAVVSSPLLTEDGVAVAVDKLKFDYRNPLEMNLLDGEVWQLQQTLLNLNNIFPEGRDGIPVKSKEIKKTIENTELV
jgi:hypothetical protein